MCEDVSLSLVTGLRLIHTASVTDDLSKIRIRHVMTNGRSHAWDCVFFTILKNIPLFRHSENSERISKKSRLVNLLRRIRINKFTNCIFWRTRYEDACVFFTIRDPCKNRHLKTIAGDKKK